MKITPDKIQFNRPDGKGFLEPGQAVVFGSNLAGYHGAGLAKEVFKNLEFPWKQGFGFNEDKNAFAFPTKDADIQPLPLKDIKYYTYLLEEYIVKYKNIEFLITEVGCGLAGYEPKDIAPMFKKISKLPNVSLPKRFWEIINK